MADLTATKSSAMSITRLFVGTSWSRWERGRFTLHSPKNFTLGNLADVDARAEARTLGREQDTCRPP